MEFIQLFVDASLRFFEISADVINHLSLGEIIIELIDKLLG